MAKLPGPLRELEQFRMTDGSGVIDLDRFLQTRGYHSFCSAHHDFMYDCERDDYCLHSTVGIGKGNIMPASTIPR